MEKVALMRHLRRASTSAQAQFLQKCREKQANVTTPTFKGTLYEYLAKEYLEKHFGCHEMSRVGGAFDGGIDLLGKWDLLTYMKPETKTSTIRATSLLRRSIEHDPAKNKLSLARDVQVLGQCKNYGRRLQASTIRELVGIFHHHLRSKDERLRTFLFLVSPFPLTRQAQGLVDQAQVPFVHCKISPQTLVGLDPYEVASWTGDSLDAVYMNGASMALLEGLDMRRLTARVR